MKAYCHTRRRADVPAGTDWLSGREQSVLDGLRFPKRRADWLLGRWTAKSALSRLEPGVAPALSDWSVEAAGDGAPTVLLRGAPSPLAISLSHSGDCSLCLLSPDRLRLGCDIEQVEHRSRSFEETFFTRSELDLLDRQGRGRRDLLVTLLWSAKESVLKAIRLGLKADTRRIAITVIETDGDASWKAFEALDGQTGQTFHGWWRLAGGMVRTAAFDLAMNEPLAL